MVKPDVLDAAFRFLTIYALRFCKGQNFFMILFTRYKDKINYILCILFSVFVGHGLLYTDR